METNESYQVETVLIVDDEPDLCEMLSFEFASQGYRVVTVMDGESALSVAEQESVWLVLTDIRMPRLDGVALVSELKRRCAQKPVVMMMSAYADVNIESAMAAGAEALFQKPFALNDLSRRARELLVPRDDRWARAPGQTEALCLEARVKNLAQAREERVLDIGRGGFYQACDDALLHPGQEVQFHIVAEEESIKEISGRGVVRWVSAFQDRAPRHSCGVEICCLEEACRADTLQWLDASPPAAFIPSPRYPREQR